MNINFFQQICFLPVFQDVGYLAKVGSILDPSMRGNVEERTITICSGLDFVNINYMHMVASTPEIAQVPSTMW